MIRDTLYTVSQLATVAGVSPRTLRYYDQIGLLQPRRQPGNGYRAYDEPAMLRLQQILFLRELDLSLDEIRTALGRPDFDLVRALEAHRVALRARQERLARLVATVERTLQHLKGELEMEDRQLFEAFDEAKQAEYEEQARQQYGEDQVRESQRRWASYSKEQKEAIGQESNAVYREILAAMPLGPESAPAQAGVAHWHQHLRYFYEPTVEVLLGLGDLYNDQPEFAANFRRIHPNLASFLRQAIQVYCRGLGATDAPRCKSTCG